MAKLIDRPVTDLTNTRRLVETHGQSLRYCGAFGWFVWDGKRWKPDSQDTAAYRYAKNTVVALLHAAARAKTDELRKKLSAAAVVNQSAGRIRAIVELARTEPELVALPEHFDADPYLLNCTNGVVDLRSGKLLPHDRSALITKLVRAEYDSKATAPRWHDFLDRIMGGRDELTAYLQRAVGYALTGDVREQVLWFLYGLGANGKSTFLLALLHILGAYAIQAASQLLVQTRSDRHPTEVADLRGRRVAVCTEIAEGQRLHEVQVKQLTGGDRIKARFMRRDFFEFDPTHKLFLATNHKPTIRGTDHAIWRRIHLVPFEVTIPKEEQDPRLLEALLEERAGILRWAIDGCLEWQKCGLQPPSAVLEATEEYRADQDRVGGFIDEECIVEESFRASASDLYEAYNEWCTRNGEEALNQRAFGEALSARGFERKKFGASRRFFRFGIGLTKRGVNPSEPTCDKDSHTRTREGHCDIGVRKGSPSSQVDSSYEFSTDINCYDGEHN